MTTECRSCRAEVVWATHDNGRSMPFDLEPSPEGTWLLERTAEGVRCVYVSADSPLWAADRALVRLHVSHFATCPNANHHRRPR